MKHTNAILIIISLILLNTASFTISNIRAADILPSFKFKRFTTINGLPSNDVQKIYQDRDGFIWIASKNGLFQYDGHTVKTFKSNLHHPKMLSNNNIFCMHEDWDQRLWIGSYKGLNMLDKKTGTVHQITRKEFINNSISTIFVTKNKRLLLGTDQGLYQYIHDKDSCILINKQNTNGVFPETTIKSMLEDSRGHLWIGTWSGGLFRYNPENNTYYAYPKMNQINSAHTLFEDSKQRIWVGTWGEGIHLLENPYDLEKLTWKTFTRKEHNSHSLQSNII